MYWILVAQPPIIRIGVGDHVRGEHVISNSRSHIPPPSSNYRHSREGGNPESQRPRRWPWTPRFRGGDEDQIVETRAVLFISLARTTPSRRRPSPGAWSRATALPCGP